MSESRWARWAPLTGIAFIVLAVLSGILVGSTPDTSDSPQQVLSFYNDHDGRVTAGALVAALGGVFLLFFVPVLRNALRTPAATGSILPDVVFAGGIVLVSGIGVGSGILFTLGADADHLTADGAHLLNILNSDLFLPFVIGSVALIFAAGLAIIRTGGLPRWLGWVAIVIGIASLTPAGFIAFLVAGVWLGVVSVLLALRGGRATSAGAATP
jgi:hypothetical protein